MEGRGDQQTEQETDEKDEQRETDRDGGARVEANRQ